MCDDERSCLTLSDEKLRKDYFTGYTMVSQLAAHCLGLLSWLDEVFRFRIIVLKQLPVPPLVSKLSESYLMLSSWYVVTHFVSSHHQCPTWQGDDIVKS
jgi:hypothetical protein